MQLQRSRLDVDSMVVMDREIGALVYLAMWDTTLARLGLGRTRQMSSAQKN
jgi:hypothetical protein